MSKKQNSFDRLLLQNEYAALKGKNSATIWSLFLIMFITFLSFGFSKSALNYQNKLKVDPFSNWINFPYNTANEDGLRQLATDAQSDSVKEKFNIRHSFFYSKWRWKVLDRYGNAQYDDFQFRSIEEEAGVLAALLNKENVHRRVLPENISNDSVFIVEPNGVIVKKDLLDFLDLSDQTVSHIVFRHFSDNSDWVALPIIAVVYELPDLSDAITTNAFYSKTYGSYYKIEETYRFFVEDLSVEDFKLLADTILATLGRHGHWESVEFDNTFGGHLGLNNWLVTIYPVEPYLTHSEINKHLRSLNTLNKYHWGPYFELDRLRRNDYFDSRHDHLAVEFGNLNKIRDFSKHINDEYKLKLNMEVLTQRENYVFTGNIALGAIIMVLLLSIISVTIFIASAIRNHLERIKKNLGNFLAFGVKNELLVKLYIFVALRILLTAMLPAFVLAFVIGELFERTVLVRLLILDPSENYFSLVNLWFMGFILLIIFIAIYRTYISVSYILKHTPGDLVYERDGKE